MNVKGRSLFSKKIHAYGVFFPVAALYAAIAVPVSLLARYHGSALFPGLNGLHHGHEMLFGFALALVAGYLLGRVSRIRLTLLLGLWLIARISYTTAPDSLIAGLSSPLFAFVLAGWVAPKFRVAKKWRNQMLTPLLVAICSFPLIFLVARHYSGVITLNTLMHASLLLLALLMAYMGGRTIAPAVAGELYKQGINLTARVQPAIEGAVILLLPTAALLVLVLPSQALAGVLVIITGCLLVIRLIRWRLWRCRQRPDLIGLGVGYGWLAVGIMLFGLSLVLGRYHMAALHVITVGAIGSLSTSIMLRVHFQRSRRQFPSTALVMITISSIAVATVCRAIAGLGGENTILPMTIAAITWCIAFLSVASQLISSQQCKPN